jgi:hypothetical protein
LKKKKKKKNRFYDIIKKFQILGCKEMLRSFLASPETPSSVLHVFYLGLTERKYYFLIGVKAIISSLFDFQPYV